MRSPWRRVSSLVSLALVAAALWILHRELRATTLEQIASDLQAFPATSLAAAVAFTTINYLILTGYDQLAFRYIGRAVSWWRVTVAAFVGFAVSNNVGFAVVSGTSARYRFYSRWGITGQDLWRVVVFYSVTFWLGLVLLGGWSLALGPVGRVQTAAPSGATRAFGWVLITLAAAYPLAMLAWRRPITVAGTTIGRPTIPVVGLQFALSVLDWMACAAALFVLLPSGRPPFAYFLGAFLAGQLAGLISHVPGGLGVFESAMILLLKPWLAAEQVLPALAAFRLVYYLLPLVVALGVLLADEFRQRSARAAGWAPLFGSLPTSLTPKLLALVTALAGSVLVFSGVTPPRPSRIEVLQRWWPLPALEVAHLVTSAAGLGVLAVSWGIARRLIDARTLAAWGLGIGAAGALAKGLHVEAALVALLVLVVILATSREFDRPLRPVDLPIPPVWLASIAVVGLASVGLGAVAAHHVRLDAWLWREVAWTADAARATRASALVIVGLVALGAWQAAGAVRRSRRTPSPADHEALARAIAGSERVPPLVTWPGDLRVACDDTRAACVLYAAAGSTWVGFGDPIGPEAAARGALAAFLERVDDHAGVPVLHEVTRPWLPRYVEAGFTFARLGDEARLDLRSPMVASAPMLDRGLAFWVLTESERLERGADLRAISDEWCRLTGTRDVAARAHRGEPVPARSFVGAVERDGRMVAFCTMVTTAARSELALDLVRHRAEEPAAIGLGIAGAVARWAAAEGYAWLTLGLVPLAPAEDPALAELQGRLARFAYAHAEEAPTLQSLRDAAERFGPRWEPRYIAYPGGLSLARVLVEVAALVQGQAAGPASAPRPRLAAPSPR